jgi:predicted ester cyclase
MAKVRSALEEAGRGNLNALNQIDDPNIVVQSYPFPEMKGLQAVKQVFSGMNAGFSDIRMQWEEMISEGDRYAARYVMRMKHTGTSPMFPIPPTGKEVVVNGCFFAREKNGKDIEVAEYDDWLGMLQQLGVVPPMGQK